MATQTLKQKLVNEITIDLLKEEAVDISREELVQKIKDTKGAYFTVTFIKKDGTERTMNARFGVTKYLKGGSLPYDPISKGLLPVFDQKTGEYRMINTATLLSAKVSGEEYKVK
jgi:hypothetical protein